MVISINRYQHMNMYNQSATDKHQLYHWKWFGVHCLAPVTLYTLAGSGCMQVDISFEEQSVLTVTTIALQPLNFFNTSTFLNNE